MPIIGIFLGWCFPNFSWASIEVDGIYYELDSLNNTAQVVEGHYHGDITIPADVVFEGKTYSITSIGESAFRLASISSVVIGDNVTTIGKRAFYDCHVLKSVTIGKGVTTIGELAFYECSTLPSITIPGNVRWKRRLAEHGLGNDCRGFDYGRVCFSGCLYEQPETGGIGGLSAGKAGDQGG